jgi:hypothetical protein
MMKRNDALVVLCLVAANFTVGCAASPEDEDSDIGVARSAALNANALNANALNANALNANALNANALNANALNANALNANALSADALAAIQGTGEAGDLSRELLRYMVGCALDSTQSLSFTWTDENNVSHQETYTGLLGLATGWASGPLSVDGQKWVSACLISRVNHYGISVTLSSRGSVGALDTTAAELAAYTHEEGAFWGNVFTDPPTAYACDHGPNDTYSRSHDRVCAAGWVDGNGGVHGCGIIQRVGSCAAACGTLTSGSYYASCSNPSNQSSSQIVTVFLE